MAAAVAVAAAAAAAAAEPSILFAFLVRLGHLAHFDFPQHEMKCAFVSLHINGTAFFAVSHPAVITEARMSTCGHLLLAGAIRGGGWGWDGQAATGQHHHQPSMPETSPDTAQMSL